MAQFKLLYDLNIEVSQNKFLTMVFDYDKIRQNLEKEELLCLDDSDEISNLFTIKYRHF